MPYPFISENSDITILHGSIKGQTPYEPPLSQTNSFGDPFHWQLVVRVFQ